MILISQYSTSVLMILLILQNMNAYDMYSMNGQYM